jgi:RNA polymerase sigma-70 factor (ECF subfamily)
MARGEDAALALLYDRWAGLVLAGALRVTRDRVDAEEVVVEAFSQAWRTADRFDSARGSVPAWLSTIARTRALDLVRSRGRRSRIEETAAGLVGAPASAGAAPAEPDAPILSGERDRAVAAALAELPEPQREAIQLAFPEGLSQSQIAAQPGEPPGTVKTRVRLAMSKLRDPLRPYYVAEPVR